MSGNFIDPRDHPWNDPSRISPVDGWRESPAPGIDPNSHLDERSYVGDLFIDRIRHEQDQRRAIDDDLRRRAQNDEGLSTDRSVSLPRATVRAENEDSDDAAAIARAEIQKAIDDTERIPAVHRLIMEEHGVDEAEAARIAQSNGDYWEKVHADNVARESRSAAAHEKFKQEHGIVPGWLQPLQDLGIPVSKLYYRYFGGKEPKI
jgi:hypothetical protein